VCVTAAGGKQDKPGAQPTSAAASTTRDKTGTERNIEEMIQPKKAAAPTKAGIYVSLSVLS